MKLLVTEKKVVDIGDACSMEEFEAALKRDAIEEVQIEQETLDVEGNRIGYLVDSIEVELAQFHVEGLGDESKE